MKEIVLCDKKDCCGCTACYAACPTGCIQMVADEEGFRYPSIDEMKCIKCGKCMSVCPFLNPKEEKEKQQKTYIYQNGNKDILKQSTSGGAFSAISELIIDKGGVVFGAAFDEDFNVCHQYVSTKEELHLFRNSKYVQSNMGENYGAVKDFLYQGKTVLFSGTPCQVEGLLAFLGGKRTEKLYVVDVVCRATPSPLYWEKYREYRAKGKKIEGAAFRSKSKYGYLYSQMQLRYNDNTEYNAGVESDPYLRGFFSDLTDRPSCYDCKFKKRYRESDLTIWDCFTVHRFSKKFNNNQGVSRILVHSEKGLELVDILRKEQPKNLLEIDVEEAIKGVKEMVQSVRKNEKRELFFIDLHSMDMDELIRKWFPDTVKVKLERTGRKLGEQLGIYQYIKRFVNFLRGRSAF